MTIQPNKKKSGRPNVFGMGNDQCVWSRAGIAKPMKCMNAFDCLGCAFDRKVQADFQARQPQVAGAVVDPRPVRLRMLINQRKCRHMLSGRVTYKLCGHGYNCVQCPYDQMLEDAADMPHLSQPGCDQAQGFDVARDYYFHHGHTWARVEYGGRVRIGVDDFAARMLGPQDEIELPRLGDDIRQGRRHTRLKRGRHAADSLSPVDGKVVAVNPKIGAAPDKVNQSPYAGGWLAVVQPTHLRKNLKNLFYGAESLAWMDEEATRLATMVSETSDYPLAASGGEAVKDIYGSIPGLDWDRLVEEFLY